MVGRNGEDFTTIAHGNELALGFPECHRTHSSQERKAPVSEDNSKQCNRNMVRKKALNLVRLSGLRTNVTITEQTGDVKLWWVSNINGASNIKRIGGPTNRRQVSE